MTTAYESAATACFAMIRNAFARPKSNAVKSRKVILVCVNFYRSV